MVPAQGRKERPGGTESYLKDSRATISSVSHMIDKPVCCTRRILSEEGVYHTELMSPSYKVRLAMSGFRVGSSSRPAICSVASLIFPAGNTLSAQSWNLAAS